MNYNLLKNILNIYELEVRKNTKNKQKIYNFEKYKIENINTIYNIINNYNGSYKCYYNIFLITRPKVRVIMSLNIKDKIINHYITRFVLIPKLEKYLDIRNVATRKNMGTNYARKLVVKFIEKNKKYKDFYVLKLDISKYFYSINHEVLKQMLVNELEEKEYNFVCNIIDSTNLPYISKTILYYKDLLRKNKNINQREVDKIPIYEYGKGLPIGNMTSQFLSIYYLNNLDHKIVHDYHIKYYIRYMDDFILIDKDKDKLKKVYALIEEELTNKYKLELNKNKCHITNIKDGFVFLGYNYKVINNKTIITLCKESRKRITKRISEVNFLYKNNYINFKSFFSSINAYYNMNKKYSSWYIRRTINKTLYPYEFKK